MRVKTEVDTAESYSDKKLVIESTNDDNNVTITVDGVSIVVDVNEFEQACEPHFFNAAEPD